MEKDLKDKQAAAQKQYKNAAKNTETGEIKSLAKNLEQFLTILFERQKIEE